MEDVIVVKDLTKRFGHFVAVDNISFNVKKGEIFGFLGANGAGKTTAMRMLCGLSRPTSGEAMVGGFDIRHESERIKKNIGYMSQKFSLYQDLKVWENTRGNKTNVLIFHEDEGYLVVLRKAKDYILPWTAYLVAYKSRKEKLLKEYEAYIKSKER